LTRGVTVGQITGMKSPRPPVVAASLAFLAPLLLAATAPAQPRPATRPASVHAYYIGHSLASDIPDLVAALATGHPDVQFRFKEQNIPGASLQWQWGEREREAGKRSKPEPQFQALWFEALPTGRFDTVVMIDSVPRGPNEMAGTRDYATRFARESLKANPAARVFLYEPWHCIKSGTPAGCDWDKSSPTRTLRWPERVSADAPMWDRVTDEVRAEVRKDFKDADLRLIPAARALVSLKGAIDKGEVPGFQAYEDLFDDDIHLNAYGKYFVACVHYAVLTGRSPVGLPGEVKNRWGGRYWDTPNWQGKSWKPPAPAAVRRMQEIAWAATGGK
jgi:hypothetical protein